MDSGWINLRSMGFSKYEAHPDGFIRNATTKRILTTKNKNYIELYLKLDNGTLLIIKVNFIILSFFISPPPAAGYVPIHKNGDTFNSSVSNLFWGTELERREYYSTLNLSSEKLKIISLKGEIWKSCEMAGYPFHCVSTMNRVYSAKIGKILSVLPNIHGYLQVSIKSNGKNMRIFIHKLVCIAFHGLPPNDSYSVDHINRNISDNRPENLRWATPSEQSLNQNRRKPNSMKVAKIDKGNIIELISQEEAVDLHGLRSSNPFKKGFFKDGFFWIFNEYLDLPGEEWRLINIEGKQLRVSNKGRIKNNSGKITSGTSSKGQLNDKPYKFISIGIPGSKTLRPPVHRLIAQGFLGDIPKGYVVNHIDGDPSNNMVENLEIVSPSQNRRHTFFNDIDSSIPVKRIPLDGSNPEIYLSLSDAAKQLKIYTCEIRRVLDKPNYTAQGAKWESIQKDRTFYQLIVDRHPDITVPPHIAKILAIPSSVELLTTISDEIIP